MRRGERKTQNGVCLCSCIGCGLTRGIDISRIVSNGHRAMACLEGEDICVSVSMLHFGVKGRKSSGLESKSLWLVKNIGT